MPELPQKTEPVAQQTNNVLDLSSLSDDEALSEEENLEAGRSRKIRRRWIIGISLLLIVAIIAASVYYYIQINSTPQVTYQFQQVTRGNLTLTASATGPIQADTYDANFSDSGTISALYVKVGDSVKKSQKLAQITLVDGSTKDLEAPHAGIVTVVNGKVNDTISANTVATGNNSFIQITDLTSLHIQANVNEADIGKVAVQNPVQFTVSAYSGQTFTGKVSAISPIGKIDSSVVTYPVTVDVDKSDLQGVSLLPNMTANVTITTESRTNVLLIPAKSVTFARQALPRGLITFNQLGDALTQGQQLMTNLKQAGKDPVKNHYTSAFVLEQSNNKWIVKAVVLGLTDGSSYELIAGDVSAADKLVVGQQNASSTSTNGNQLQLPGNGAPPGGGAPLPGGPGGGSGQP